VPAENPDPYKNWLEDFNREVDETVAQGAALSAEGVPPRSEDRSPLAAAPPEKPSVERALSDFQNWWTGETSDPQKGPELEVSREEVRILKAQMAAQQDPGGSAPDAPEPGFKKQEEERLRLKGRIEQLENDNTTVQRQHDEIQRQAAELRLSLSKAQESHAEDARRQDEKLRHLSEQLRLLGEDRQFLQNDHSRQASRIENLEAELKAAATEAARHDSEKRELQRRIAQLESGVLEAETRRAVLEATLNELRMQAGDLQERFVRSQRCAAAELEAQRRKAAEESVPPAASEKERLEAEQRLRETTRYLELKLREVQDENKGRLEEFREMLESVSRLGARQ